ncbi:MAG: phenylacetate--CoA ligase [Actinobacteria bacterium]|nr:phenylacetate--CoA ligase [Actinomycetota bacterium]
MNGTPGSITSGTSNGTSNGKGPSGHASRAAAAAGEGRSCFDPKHETLELGALRALQLERLRGMVTAAYERSAVYRRMCREAGAAPADMRTLDDVRRLPFLEKTTLRDTYPDGLRLCGLDAIIEVHSTSGTTGKPTPIWVTRRDMDAWALRNARSLWMVGLRPSDLLQNCFGYGLPTSVGLQYGAQHAGIGVVPAGIGRQELLIDLIMDLRVTALCTTPSYALYLAEKAKERGIDLATDSQLRIGLFGAEPWPESGRERLAAALGVEAFNEYGMGELLGPGMACECPVRDGMHVWSDHLLVECIDPETCEPVAEGQPGELVWTSLTSDSMAMIRYRSHDISSLSWAPCACGRTHPRIGRITGRSDDALSIGGLVVFPSQIEEVLVRFDEFGSNFCMVVENVSNLDRLTLQVEIRGFDELSDDGKARLAKTLAGGVKATVGVTPRMELHAPLSLPRDTDGQGKTACHRVDDRRSC